MNTDRENPFTDERLQHIADLAGDGCTPDIVQDFIDYEWDNMDEHQAWVVTADDKEIAGWIRACRK